MPFFFSRNLNKNFRNQLINYLKENHNNLETVKKILSDHKEDISDTDLKNLIPNINNLSQEEKSKILEAIDKISIPRLGRYGTKDDERLFRGREALFSKKKSVAPIVVDASVVDASVVGAGGDGANVNADEVNQETRNDDPIIGGKKKRKSRKGKHSKTKRNNKPNKKKRTRRR